MTVSSGPIIRLSDVSFQYREQSAPTLHHVSLEIVAGEKVAIVGPSGCGKSTLLRVINGLVPHYFPGELTGQVEVAGLDPATVPLEKLSLRVGTVLQDMSSQFVGMTVAEDIAFSLENQGVPTAEMRRAVPRTAAVVGMERLLDHAPQELSGGQKQRVAMAGVLVDNVDVLLFDEPLAMLDPASGRASIELIDRLQREYGKTEIIVEHRVEDVLHRPVDRVIVMDAGRIVADLGPDELVASDILESHGIRPPLHVAALKYAGVRLGAADRAASPDTLVVTEPLAARVREWVQATESEAAAETTRAADATGRTTSEHAADANAREATAPERPEIEVRDVVASYEGDDSRHLALDGVSVSVPRGQILGIVGSNGAGKSTLARVITGFLGVDAGEVLIGGERANEWSIAKRGEQVGFVLQEPSLMLSRTLISEEIELGLKARGLPREEIDRRRDTALRACGLWPYRKWPVSALSHGQKKRLTIATILALEPRVLILDEPTAGQDYAHYSEFMDFLEDLNAAGVTIVLITHDMHLALEYTSRVVVMSNRRVLAVDSPDRVLTDESITSAADLVTTSLYTLARRTGVEDPSALVRAFLAADRARRAAARTELEPRPARQSDQGDEKEAHRG